MADVYASSPASDRIGLLNGGAAQLPCEDSVGMGDDISGSQATRSGRW